MVAGAEDRDADHERPEVLALEEDDGDQHLVPDPESLDGGNGRERGQGDRQDDRPQAPQVARAVDAGRVEQFARHRAEEADEQKGREREQQARVDRDDAPVRVELPEVGRELEERNDEHDRRQHHEGDEDAEDPVAGPPAHEGERVGGDGGDRRRQEHGCRGDHERVEEPAAELAAPQRVAERPERGVVRDPVRVREVFVVGLQPVDDHEVQGHERPGDDGKQHEVLRQPPRPVAGPPGYAKRPARDGAAPRRQVPPPSSSARAGRGSARSRTRAA